MCRKIALLSFCAILGWVGARPQVVLPSPVPLSSPFTFPIRQPVYFLRPNGQLIYFPNGFPTSQTNIPVRPGPLLRPPMPMPLPVPAIPGHSALPLPMRPYFGNVNPYIIVAGPRTSGNEESNRPTIHPHEEIQTSNNVSQTNSSVSLGSLPKPLDALVEANLSAVSPITSTLPPTIQTTSERVKTKGDYSFHYSVNNPQTGDIKSQEEKRVDGVVSGFYMLADADGKLRMVNYTADAQHGFKATVSRMPLKITNRKEANTRN